MSFLDRFKRKASDEKALEHSSEAPPESTPETGSAPAAPAKKIDPAVQIAAAAVAAGYNPDFKLPPRKEKEPAPAAPAADTGPKHEVILDLGDFLPRLPTPLLKDETHDPKTPLSFDIAELADRIARGQTTIGLVEVYRRVPGIFRAEVLPSDATEIRFPWQRVMKMLTAYKGAPGEPAPDGLSLAAAETLAEKLRSRRAVRNIGSGPAAAEAPVSTPTPAPAPSAPAKPPELILPTSNAEDDEKMTKEEALKARDHLRSMLARIKGEFERHLAAGDQQRRTLSEEREKMVVDLIRTKREIDDKHEQVEFEKSVAAKSAEHLTKTQQERDAFKIELSNLKVELGKLSQQNEQRIKDLITERDALAQQQANLSKQLTDQKRGKPAATAAPETAPAAAAAERSQREYQRQLEELQRRINVLETGQREAAQELGREREAKIKLERQLLAADRLQEESAAKVQEMQAVSQRENEAAARKREAEAGRALKEIQEQLAALQTGNQKLQADLDETRKQLAAAQESTASAAASPEAWEARATAQLEADIDSYRTRIKSLLQERGTLSTEKQKLAEELTARTRELAQRTEEKEALAKADADAKAQDRSAQLTAENEKLQATLKALQAERDRLAAKGKTLEEKIAAGAVTVVALQKLTAEKEGAIAELDKVKSELKEAGEKHQQELQQAQERHAAELAAREAALQKAAAIDPAEIGKLQAELEAARAGLQAAHADSTATIGTLRAETKKALAEREALAAEFDKLKGSQHADKERLERELAAVRQARAADDQALAALQAGQEKSQAENKALADEMAALRTAREASGVETEAARAALAELTADRDDLRQKFEALSKQLAAARKQSEELNAARDTLAAENIAARTAWENSLADAGRQRDQLLATIETLNAELAGAKQEHGLAFAALDRDRDILRAAKETLIAEFATARTTYEKTFGELRASQAALAASQGETAEAVQLGKILQAQLEKTAAALAEAQAGLRKGEENAARQAREHAEALANLNAKHERVLAALTAEKDAAFAQLTSEKATLVAEVEDRMAALQAGHEKAVHGLRSEKSDAVIRLTEEMNATIGALTAERDKVRDALTAAERKYPAEIAVLVEARDSALRDSAVVAERLAEISVDAERKYAQLTAERDALLAEKQKIAADYEQARETHKAQAGVFASEFKTVVKQRDDIIAQLETERRNLAEKTIAFERERAAALAADHETKARFEREIARIRRERDSIAQQRDGLRTRIEKVMEDQRQMLEEITHQAAFTAMKHSDNDAAVPPAETPEPDDEERERAAKLRESKAREPRKKEANVIDITEAEIVAPMQGGEGRLKMPRVRPVIIPPPQVRSL